MDYEKKYNEALERAKQVHEYSSDLAEIKRMEQIFPELKEPEDEKIRKWLIADLKETLSTPRLPQDYIDIANKALAWLEKQSEQKEDPRYSIIEELIAADDIFQMSVNESMVKEAEEKALNAIQKLEVSKLLGLEKLNYESK